MNEHRYHIFVKYKGCQGKSCRRCEDFLPGFFEEFDGDMKFDERILENPGTRGMIFEAIRECPAGCLGWESLNK